MNLQVVQGEQKEVNLKLLLTSFVSDVSYDTEVAMDTRTINLRDLPEELVRRAKACAALHGMTLRDFVMRAVEKATQEDLPTFTSMAATALPSTTSSGRKKKGK